MKRLIVLALVPALFACDFKARQQLAELQSTDSLRQDSLMTIKNQLLNDMLVANQFINDVNTEIAKARGLAAKKAANASTTTPAEAAKIKEDREEVLGRIRTLVSRLGQSESRLAALRKQAATFADRDSTLSRQIAEYEKSLAETRQTLERQRAEMQGIIDQQNVKIAGLNATIDTATQKNTQLTGEKVALIDTVSQLTRDKNTVYYVIGTRDELVAKGILAEEGRKQFLFVGNRPVGPARSLDPSAFTSIDRTKVLDISLPEGEYVVASRQDQSLITPNEVRGGHIVGGLKITNPEQFWATSKFLILRKM